MSAIPGTEWDTELLVDRVDVIRRDPGKGPAGNSRPVSTTVRTAVPCYIQRTLDPTRTRLMVGQSTQAMAIPVVAFAEDVGLEPDDLLHPVPPSIGSNLRVGSYAFSTLVGLYVATCSSAT